MLRTICDILRIKVLAEVYAASTTVAVTTHSVVHEAPHSSETRQAHAKYTHLKF